MPTPYLLIFCTCPNQDSAEKIAYQLINEKLAACVNILPSITSIYSWQGQTESAQELLLLIKAHSDYYLAIEQAIKTLHPYELPEIIANAIAHGSPQYLQWIDSCHTRV